MRDDFVTEFTVGNVTIWMLPLRELSEAEYQEMYSFCSGERREKADRIKSEMKRRQSIGAGYLTALLRKRFSIAEEPVILPGGKPVFLENGQKSGQNSRAVHFNISHSRDLVLMAFGNMPLGVDIEYIKKADLKLAERFFAREEYEFLLEQDKSRQGELFYWIWTRKEAVIKAAGSGLSMPLDCFSVLNDVTEVSGSRYELYQRRMLKEEILSAGESVQHQRQMIKNEILSAEESVQYQRQIMKEKISADAEYEPYQQNPAQEAQDIWISTAQLIE